MVCNKKKLAVFTTYFSGPKIRINTRQASSVYWNRTAYGMAENNACGWHFVPVPNSDEKKTEKNRKKQKDARGFDIPGIYSTETTASTSQQRHHHQEQQQWHMYVRQLSNHYAAEASVYRQ